MTGKPVGDLAWLFATMQVEDSGNFAGIAELLRNEAFVLDIHSRRQLADLLPGERKQGRKSEGQRDLDLYHAVTSFKLEHGLKKLPNAELLKIAARYGLHSTDTVNTAVKNGRRIAAEIEAINRENADD